MASTLLISTLIVHFSPCTARSGGLITRSAVVGKVGGLKWTLWTLILHVRYTQIKHASLGRTEDLEVAVELYQEDELRLRCSILHPTPNRHPRRNAGSRVFPRLTLKRFFTTSLSVFLSPHTRVVNLLKVIRFSFETSPMKWDNYSDQTAPIRRYWIFVVCLRWMMHVCIQTPVLAALHASFLSFLFPRAVNRGFSKDFGKKGPSAMPNTPSGGSKVVPIASLNPYQSKWVWLSIYSLKMLFNFYGSAGGDSLSEQVDLLSAGVAANVANDCVLLKRAWADDSCCPEYHWWHLRSLDETAQGFVLTNMNVLSIFIHIHKRCLDRCF